MQVIEELRSLDDGEGEILKSIVTIFEESSNELLQELSDAMEAGEAGRLALAAHSLKGSASNLGAVLLSVAALELEKAGKAGELSGTEEGILKARQEFSVALSCLHQQV
ncbi:MAG: Hpt domain-containing protein [Kofleriaceae bacterium]|nr:Hpt domain-containing protein [Kofleriaceae bacterium]